MGADNDRMPSAVRYRTVDLAGLAVPLIDIQGASDGPLLTVLAGVHGCEYAAMAAVRAWARGLASRELRGRVRAVPVLNLPAFRARSPFVVPEDGKNLNRCFPGDPAGTLSERLADAVFRELITGSDAMVDAHSGDLVEALEPFTLYDTGPAGPAARDLATAYGLRYVVGLGPGPEVGLPGTTSAAAAAIGVPAIIAEAGGCGLVDQAAVRAHLTGLDGVLAVAGISGEPVPARSVTWPRYLDRSAWLRSSGAGWWEPAVRPGQDVAAGQPLGTVSTLDGARVLQSVTAPSAGVVLFLTTSPAVAADGLLLGLGTAGPGNPGGPDVP
jgi:predicted deacylase